MVCSTAVIQFPIGETAQSPVDLPIDLDSLLHQTRAGLVAPLSRNADFLDTDLARRGLDHVDPPGDFAPIVLGWEEQIWLERNEQITAHIVTGPRPRGQSRLPDRRRAAARHAGQRLRSLSGGHLGRARRLPE
jgi:hypothetical protein